VGSGVCPRTFSMKAYTTSDVDGLITISPPALVPSPCVRPSSQSADGLQCVRVSWSHCRMVSYTFVAGHRQRRGGPAHPAGRRADFRLTARRAGTAGRAGMSIERGVGRRSDLLQASERGERGESKHLDVVVFYRLGRARHVLDRLAERVEQLRQAEAVHLPAAHRRVERLVVVQKHLARPELRRVELSHLPQRPAVLTAA